MWAERVRLAEEFDKIPRSKTKARKLCWGAFLMADDRQRDVMDEIRRLENAN
jgi:hypothetical protein